MKRTPPPEISVLHELFRLDTETGSLYWRKAGSHGCSKPGAPAGSLHPQGYRQVGINWDYFLEHRIVFAMIHGRWPDEIDHINGITNDNRPCNLREATRAQNCRNRGMQSNNTSGAKGVTLNKRTGKWQAQITVSGKNIYLGNHTDIDLAGLIYSEAARIYHGEFSRTGVTP